MPNNRTLDDITTEATGIKAGVADILEQYRTLADAVGRLRILMESLKGPHAAPVGLITPGEVPSAEEVRTATEQATADILRLEQFRVFIDNAAIRDVNRAKLTEAQKRLGELQIAARRLPGSRGTAERIQDDVDLIIDTMRRMLSPGQVLQRKADIRDGLVFGEQALEKLVPGGVGFTQEELMAGAVGMVGLGGVPGAPGMKGAEPGWSAIRRLLGRVFRKGAAKANGGGNRRELRPCWQSPRLSRPARSTTVAELRLPVGLVRSGTNQEGFTRLGWAERTQRTHSTLGCRGLESGDAWDAFRTDCLTERQHDGK
jgi:hypothetical protein